MKNIMIAIALMLGTTQAFARDTRENRTSPQAWACSMGFQGEAVGVKLIIGFYKFNGKGTLNCISASNERVSYPITVSMRAAPLSANLSLAKMELAGVAGNISLLNTYP